MNARLEDVALNLAGCLGADVLDLREKGNRLYQLRQAFARESGDVHARHIATERLQLDALGKKRGLDFVLERMRAISVTNRFTPGPMAGKFRDVQRQQQACRSC